MKWRARTKAQSNTFLGNECKGSVPSFIKSNPDLKPETSRSYTLGLVFEPVKNRTLALDYYNIERKDEIGTRTIGDVLKSEASLPAGQLLRVDSSAADNEYLALVNKYAPGNTVNFQNIGKLGMIYNRQQRQDQGVGLRPRRHPQPHRRFSSTPSARALPTRSDRLEPVV